MTSVRPFRVALLFLLILSAPARAVTTSAHGFDITAEPIIGYEYTLRDTPTPHRGGMLIYGARFTAGRPHIAVEGEYTRGSDTEAFTSPSVTTVTTTRENARLGVRGTYELTSSLSALARLGGQASRAKVEQGISGLTSTNEGKWLLKPYAGAGLQLALAQVLSVGVEATYAFNSLEDFTQNTVQLAGSIRINLNAK